MPIVFADGFDHYSDYASSSLGLTSPFSGWRWLSSSAGALGNNRGGRSFGINYTPNPGYTYMLYRDLPSFTTDITVGVLLRFLTPPPEDAEGF